MAYHQQKYLHNAFKERYYINILKTENLNLVNLQTFKLGIGSQGIASSFLLTYPSWLRT